MHGWVSISKLSYNIWLKYLCTWNKIKLKKVLKWGVKILKLKILY